MITLLTGKPGNGKTLYAIDFVKGWAEKESRPVFYSGIKDLALPWTEIDPQKWFDCPPNSIIVIDECQSLFRPRSFSSQVPDYVSRLETHRHQGLDLVLITQNPLLVDSHIRRLAGRHLHVMRKFGTQSATIHEWATVKDDCDKNGRRDDSIKHAYKYNTKAFEWYKSAEVHTVKRSIPFRVYFVYIVLPLVLIGTAYYMYRFVDAKRNSTKPDDAKLATTPNSQPKQLAQSPAQAGGVQRVSYANAKEDAKQYVFDRRERIQGLPHTAPRYDEVTKPTTAPLPVACVSSKSKGCNCYSQQATLMAVPQAVCLDIVARGYFVDFDDGHSKRQAQNQPMQRADAVAVKATPGQVPVTVNVAPAASEKTKVSDARAFSSDGYGVLGKKGGGVRRRTVDDAVIE